jgi:pimeloyl-ACP methyl ester carboxylesterase
MMRKGFVLVIFSLLIATAVCLAGCGEQAEPEPENKGPATLEDITSIVDTQTVTVGDIEIAYRVLGEGDPLVMIMGFSGTMDIWCPDFLLDLSKQYQVITFDNRGMGDTTAGLKEFTIQQFAADTAGFMDAIGIDRGDVLGWSMGTNIAGELVLDYPEKVDRLILYAADPGGNQAIQPTDEVLQQLTDTSGTPEERGERLFQLMFPSDWLQDNGQELQAIFSGPMEPVAPESVIKQAQAMEAWQGIYDRLPQIKSPTMLLTGTDDVLTPPSNSLIMVERIPGAWLVQFEGGGHGMMFQWPEKTANIILDFLSAP